jgi:hypothetical protein
MRILHLTDLHFSSENRELIERLKEPLIKALKKEVLKKEIDLVLFTGDLVYSGNNNAFEIVTSVFIEPICASLALEKDKFIICAGNHDLEIEKEFPAIKDYINNFKSNLELDSFVEKKDLQFENSCLNSKLFDNFIKNYYSNCKDFIFDNLFQKHIIVCNNRKIGIIAFNSAWRSFIGKDTGFLLLPKHTVLKAHGLIKDCDLKICLLHHDLSEFKTFNIFEVEDLIYEFFHLKFSGHYHKNKQEAFITPNIGMLSIFSPSSMSGDDGSKIGFSILDIDEEILEGEVVNYEYSRAENLFTEIASLPINVPVNREKKEQIDLIKSLKNAYENELLEANDLLVCDEDETITKNFLDLFSLPLLKFKSRAESIKEKKDSKNIDFVELYSHNYIVYGKDKSGKTSLLRKIELDLLQDYKYKKIIPIYIDIKKIELENVNLSKHLKQFLNLSYNRIATIIKNGTFCLLIDNFNPNKKSHLKAFEDIKNKLNIRSFILACEETLKSAFEKIAIKESFEKLFLHYLTRSEIRTHTKKWLGENSSNEQHEIIKKIESIFVQLNIPFNYWSLSLFLWLYKKEKKINIHDNIELVNLYIDGLLERKQLALSAGNIDYDTFRSFLGELSYLLLTKYTISNYALSYEELVKFIDGYRHKNIRFVAETEELLDFLIGRRILKKQNMDSFYTFRLNGVMEFFLALHMKENKSFVNEIITDELFFLEFANELEIYAGFVKNDTDFLIKIRKRVEKALEATNKQYEGLDPDNIIADKITHIDEVIKLMTRLDPEKQMPIEYDEQDRLMDNIKPIDCFDEAVKVKRPLKAIGVYSHDELEKSLFILCRVFRGLSLITNKEEVDKTLNFILDSIINLGFTLLEEIDINEAKNKKEQKSFLINLISSFIPLIVQMSLSEAILQKNLKRLIEEKITILKSEKKRNEYKLFILYYMLLDIDLPEYLYLIDDIVKTFKLFPLKNTSLFKLYYLLFFKANSNTKIQRALKEGIIKQQLEIDPKSDKSQIKQQIDKQININEHTK